MKTFNLMYNVGKAKYVVNYHNGIKKHKDDITPGQLGES